MPHARTSRGRGGAGRAALAWCALGACYAGLTLWLYGDVLAHRGPLDRDELVWIRGDTLGSPWRLTQAWLLHRVCLPLAGANRTGYQLPGLLLHVLGGLGVAALARALVAEVRGWGAATRAGVGAGWAGSAGGARRAGAGTGGDGGFVFAALAGALFVLYDSGAPRWFAALSYQLVAVFGLVALVAALATVRTGRAWPWAVATVSYGLALISHSHALALPALVALLEWIVRRRAGLGRPSRAGLALRYGALALPLAAFCVPWGGHLAHHAAGLGGAGGPGLGIGAGLGTSLLGGVRYLGLLVLRLGGAGTAEEVYLAVVVGALLAVATVVVVVRSAGRRRRGERGSPSPIGAAVLVVAGWAAATFPQTLSAEGSVAMGWRFYAPASGTALLAAAVLWAAGRALSRGLGGGERAWRGGARRRREAPAGSVAPPGGDARRGATGTSLPGWLASMGGGAWSWTRRMPLPGRIMSREGHTLAPWVALPGALTALGLALLGPAGGDARRFWSNAIRGEVTFFDQALWEPGDHGGIDLVGADLVGAGLAGADLAGAGLLWARLDGADLTGADLARATLDGATAPRADLTDATLVRASLRVVRLTGATLRDADLRDAAITDADLRDADLTNADLTGADLSRTDLRGAVLTGARLEGTVQTGVLR